MDIKELAKKLKALADQGIGGEKVNAEQKLKELIEKHNLSEDDLGEASEHRFDFKKEQKKLFNQICCHVLGKEIKTYSLKSERHTMLVAECTNLQAIEIESLFSFYYAEYERQLETFYRAFVYKNNLLPSDAMPTDDLEELAKIEEANKLMQGMDKSHFLKQISQ